jgi:hypothetical protein
MWHRPKRFPNTLRRSKCILLPGSLFGLKNNLNKSSAFRSRPAKNNRKRLNKNPRMNMSNKEMEILRNLLLKSNCNRFCSGKTSGRKMKNKNLQIVRNSLRRLENIPTEANIKIGQNIRIEEPYFCNQEDFLLVLRRLKPKSNHALNAH